MTDNDTTSTMDELKASLASLCDDGLPQTERDSQLSNEISILFQNNPSLVRELSGEPGLELADSITNEPPSIERALSVFSTALLTSPEDETRTGLCSNTCHLLTLLSAISTSRASAQISLISASLPASPPLIESFLSVARLPTGAENHGRYVSALLIARDLYGVSVYASEEGVVPEDHLPRTFRQDYVDLFARRFFALGGGATSAEPHEVRLSSPILSGLTRAEMDGPMARPLKFKLTRGQDGTYVTLGALLDVLVEIGKVDWLGDNLDKGYGLMEEATRRVKSGKEEGAVAVVELFRGIVMAFPGRLRKVLEGLLEDGRGENVDVRMNAYRVLGGLGRVLAERRVDVSHVSQMVVDALSAAKDREVGEDYEDATLLSDNALGAWIAISGEAKPAAMSLAAKPSPAFAKLQSDITAKQRARAMMGPVATRPGVTTLPNGATVTPTPRRRREETPLLQPQYDEKPLSLKIDPYTVPTKPLSEKLTPPEKPPSKLCPTHFSPPPPKPTSYSSAVSSKRKSAPTPYTTQTVSLLSASEGPIKEDKYKLGDVTDDGLAVAIAVKEEPVYSTYAEDFDPVTSAPFFAHKRHQTYAVGCLLIAILLVVGVSMQFTKEVILEGGTEPPTFAPTTTRFQEVRGYIRKFFPRKRSKYANQAMEWLIHEDGFGVDLEDHTNIIQRYVLSVLYFSTRGENWTICGDYENNPSPNCIGSADKPNVHNESRWLSPAHECEWYGVICSDALVVREVSLVENNLQGTIPKEIGTLKYLRRIWFNANYLTGTIPNEIGTMRHLLDLQLHGNELVGTIPEEIYNLMTLQSLNLGINFLTGTVSNKTGDLINLKGLFLLQNMLEGTIPEEIGTLDYLSFTFLGNNDFTGTIPTSFGNLRALKQLALDFNALSGRIPTELGNLEQLLLLSLEENRLEGPIPDEFYNMTNLAILKLGTNALTGTISNKIANLDSLLQLMLRKNNFEGTIPPAIGNNTNLRYVHLHFNKFEGQMPERICNLPRLESLYSDCLGTVQCECCTDCCDSASSHCEKYDP